MAPSPASEAATDRPVSWRDAWTIGTVVGGTVLQAVALGLLARVLGLAQFGVLMLAMRVGLAGTLVATLGMDFAAARLAAANPSIARPAAMRAIALSMLPWFFIGAALLWAPSEVSNLIFVGTATPGILAATFAYGLSGTIFGVTTMVLRAVGWRHMANRLYLGYFGTVFVIAISVLAYGGVADHLIIILVLGLPAGLSIIASLAIISSLPHGASAPLRSRDFLSHGGFRAASQITLAVFFAAALSLSLRSFGTAVFAKMTVAVLLVRLVEPLGQAATLVLLPATLRATSVKNQVAGARWLAQITTNVAALLAPLTAGAIFLWVRPISWYWLGEDLQQFAVTDLLALAASGFYLAFLIMHGTLTGLSVRAAFVVPLVMVILFLSGAFAGPLVFASPLVVLAISLVGLFLFTIVFLRAVAKISVREPLYSFVVGSCFAAPMIAAGFLFAFPAPTPLLLLGLAFGVTLSVGSVVLMFIGMFWRPSWLAFGPFRTYGRIN